MLNKNKIKFQNQDFKKKLVIARTYKRSVRKMPDEALGSFFSWLNLFSAKLKIFFICLIILLGYGFLLPNFLSIKHITISNLNRTYHSGENQTCIKQQIRWPSSNLILLSPSTLKNNIEKHCPQVSIVQNIQKDYPNTLQIAIRERFEQFLLSNQSGQYLLANDGIFLQQFSQNDLEKKPTTTNLLIPINLSNNTEEFYTNQTLAKTEIFFKLEELLVKFDTEFQNPIMAITISDRTFTNVELTTTLGFKVKINFNILNLKLLKNYEHLLNDISSSRIRSVKYIDLRVENKAYVCYKDAICAKTSAPLLPEPNNSL